MKESYEEVKVQVVMFEEKDIITYSCSPEYAVNLIHNTYPEHLCNQKSAVVWQRFQHFLYSSFSLVDLLYCHLIYQVGNSACPEAE